MGLEAGIWAWRLGFGPRGWDLGHKAERGGTEKDDKKKEKEEEKFPLCESIGHRPLRGRCPKTQKYYGLTDRQMDQPTDQGVESRARD